MEMKVLVLGHKGMLGHMVVKYLRDQNINVITTDIRWPESPFKLGMRLDYVINCIGAIPQRTNKFDINYYLPIWLDLNAPCKVIHPGTDCEMDSDDYGISKRISADYINSPISSQTKILKTSIIGPELNSTSSLLEWFLSQEGEVQGYSKAIWNGNTTLEWAKQCLNLMNSWESYKTETIIQSSKSISKFGLLTLIKQIFNKTNVTIIPKPLGTNKTLKGTLHTKGINQQLKELKEYYYKK
tara:strand:- start:74 stop:796 length:723 start_codon:yes stop_codon:yes gene_type:complete